MYDGEGDESDEGSEGRSRPGKEGDEGQEVSASAIWPLERAPPCTNFGVVVDDSELQFSFMFVINYHIMLLCKVRSLI